VKQRLNILACALVIAALVAPTAQGAGRRHPVARHHATAVKQANAFGNLGREGSGRHQSAPATNAFANLGHEGGALEAAWQTPATALRPWAA
jgi:hypothetical protein